MYNYNRVNQVGVYMIELVRQISEHYFVLNDILLVLINNPLSSIIFVRTKYEVLLVEL